MYAPGRYVRAPSVSPDREDDHDVGKFVRAPNQALFDRSRRPDHGSGEPREVDPYAHYDTPWETAQQVQAELNARVRQLEDIIKELSQTRSSTLGGSPAADAVNQDDPPVPAEGNLTVAVYGAPVTPVGKTHGSISQREEPRNDGSSGDGFRGSTAGTLPATPSEAALRWDNIRAFPKDVPATKMWEAWTLFIEDFEMAATLSSVKSSRRRAELLLVSMGSQLKSITRAAQLLPDLDSDRCYEEFVDNVGRYLKSLTDPAAEHEEFTNMVQQEGEAAIYFHARLAEKVRLCDYPGGRESEDRFVRAQLMRGLRNQELKKAARTYGLDTNNIVTSATRAEAFRDERPPATPDTNVFAIDKPQEHRGPSKRKYEDQRRPMKRFKQEDSTFNQGRSQFNQGGARFNQGRSMNNQSRAPIRRRSRCSRCWKQIHNEGEDCPAAGRTCFACGTVGHFAIACHQREAYSVEDAGRTTGERAAKKKDQQVNALSLQDVLVDCRIGSSHPIKFLIDSGSDANVVGGADWSVLEKQFERGEIELTPAKCTNDRNLQAYASNKPMRVDRSFKATIEVCGPNKAAIEAEFLVVEEGRRSLLGRETASDLNLLKVGCAINSCENPDQFPKMPGVKISFSVDRSVPPVRNAYYNIPAAYRDKARQRLAEMERQGIIEKVTSAPQWISGMSAVPKGQDDFRLVVNMRAPNKAVLREYFRLPLMDEMRVKLHGAEYFTKLDLQSAYYHLELCEDSRDLTTFLSESGMFRFCRLMFGVNAAPEIFQREMVRIFKDVKNIIIYIDDLLIFAKTIDELRKTTAEVLKILRANNLTLNTAKCKFDQTQVTFLGHELSAKGFNIEQSKISSIQKFRQPSTASELRSFLGLASFVSPYIKNFAGMSGPLWAVVNDNKWHWGEEQQTAFEAVKENIIQSTLSLGYFSDCDKTILYTDASPYALGAVLVPENDNSTPRIISFASKALSPTERKYAQNQREALGAIWAVEHFSYFLLGRHFVLRTDAQGMSFILDRPREESKRALTRADGWALRLSPYRYQVQFVKGRDNIADPSSRLYQGEDDEFDERANSWEVCQLELNRVEFLTEDEIKECTAKDDTLQKVIDSLASGKWSNELLRFKAIASDLHYSDGMLSKNGCAVLPANLRESALEVAHAGHPLEAKFKSILRKRVWWPGMAGDAEKWVKSCSTCAVNGRPEKPTPMQRSFAPKAVWDTVAVDFNGPYARLGGILILVIIDLRSRYAMAYPVKSTGFEHTRTVLDAIFGREGFPRAMKSDNGPPFNGEDYANYCSERGIQTVFSTPFFPQQNGLVECFMKNVNKAMSTALSTGSDYRKELQATVQAYNAADHTVTKVPPEEVFSGRKIKRGLPLLLRGRTEHDDLVFDARDHEAKIKSKTREDTRRGAKRSTVKPGDAVLIERQSKAKGETRFDPKRYTVMEERNGSLVVCDPDGRQLRRHVTQTKKVQQWREPRPIIQEAQRSDELGCHDQEVKEIDQQRPRRTVKIPSHLSDYIRAVEEEF